MRRGHTCNHSWSNLALLGSCWKSLSVGRLCLAYESACWIDGLSVSVRRASTSVAPTLYPTTVSFTRSVLLCWCSRIACCMLWRFKVHTTFFAHRVLRRCLGVRHSNLVFLAAFSISAFHCVPALVFGQSLHRSSFLRCGEFVHRCLHRNHSTPRWIRPNYRF